MNGDCALLTYSLTCVVANRKAGVMELWLSRADLILTDSCGVPREAPSFGTPVLVMREVTERVEAIAAAPRRSSAPQSSGS